MSYPKPSVTVAVSPDGTSSPNPVTVTAPSTVRYQMNQSGYAVEAVDLPDQLSQIDTGMSGKFAYVDVYDAFTSAGTRSSPVVLSFNLKITHVETGHTLLHDPAVVNQQPD
jgi:hypothetical protein